jgi:phage replication O-like protein O
MRKAQLENGYTRIANDLLDAIVGADLTLNETQILWSIVRLSYGWNQKTTGGRASIGNLCAMTGMAERRAYYAIKSLVDKAILKKEKGPRYSNAYQINTSIDAWKVELVKNSIEFLPVYSEIDPAQTSQVSPAQISQVSPAQISQVSPAQISQVSPAQISQGRHACNLHPMQAAEAPKYNIKDSIKDSIKESGSKTPPSGNYQKALEALGLPGTAILSPEDHQTLNALLETGCNFDDIKAARLKRKKNRLAWIQDTVCEERDKRQAGINDLKALQAEANRLYGGN